MKIPTDYYPSSGLNPIHAVNDWAYVRRLIRAARSGATITPILYEGLPNNGSLLAGTHRLAANEVIAMLAERTGERHAPSIGMVALDDVIESPEDYDLTPDAAEDLANAVSDGAYDVVDKIWDRR